MRRMAPALALAFIALSTARCALVSGLDGLSVGEGTDAATATDASDASSRDAVADAPADVAPPDGGCTCVPIPAGWTSVRFAAATNTPCPIGEPSADLTLGPFAGAATGSCTCTCTTNVTCANPTAEFFGTVACGNLAGVATVNTSGACLPFPVAPNGIDSLHFAPVSATCTGTAAALPSASSGSGRRCTPPSTCGTGLGCDGATGPFAACISRDGDQTCPTDYPKRTAAASSVVDGRVCSGCAGCNVSSPACTYDLKTFKNNACTQTTGTASGASGACTQLVGEAFYTATVKATATCTPSAGTGSGSTTVMGLQTICCKG